MSKLQLNLIRTVIILALVLMMVYSDRGLELNSPAYYLALAYLLFNLGSFLITKREFYLSPLFHYVLIIIDIAVVTIALYLTSGFESDFYLIYFLVIFVSSAGSQTRGSLYTAIVIAIIYAWIYSRGNFSLLLDTKFLIRIPFFIIIAFYTSLWASSVRLATEEKKKMEEFNIKLRQQVNEAVAKFEDASRFSENLMRSVRSGIIAIDMFGKIVLFNPHAKEVLKVSEELIRKDISKIKFLEPIANVLIKTLNNREEIHREIMTVQLDDEEKKIGLSTAILRDNNNATTGNMMIFSDLTEVFKLQQKLKRSEHLAHIGEMASWVAHEIKNPLSTIQGFSELIAKQDDQEKRTGYLKNIKEGTRRIDGIISDILYLSKDKPHTLEPVSLNQVLVIVAENIKALVDFDLKLDLPKEIIAIRGHRDRLTRVFENLIMNSIEAKASLVEVDLKAFKNGAGISIKDNGSGMDEETKKKIFAPFYTTKEKGTGLGLAICEKIIVEDHKGEIYCESEIGEGTAFRIFLPREEESN